MTLAARCSYSAFDSARFVPCKCTCDIVSYGSAALNLGSCPHPELQYVLELLRQIVPSVVIAGRVCGKIIINVVSATRTMCEDVVGLPLFVLDLVTTEVTAARCLIENLSSFCGGQ